jgi:hypothetical protein
MYNAWLGSFFSSLNQRYVSTSIFQIYGNQWDSQREEAKKGIGTRTLYIHDPCRAAFWPR